MNYLKLGFRNILRNRRRSLVTLLAIASGFASINLFAGYIKNTYSGLTDQSVKGERLGHLTVVKQGLFIQGKIDPEKYMFNLEEVEQVKKILLEDPDVALVTPRLNVSGIVSNGTISTIFIGEGIVQQDVDAIRQDFRADRSGRLNPDNPIGAAVANDLAAILNVKKGEGAVLLTTTPSGQANALDIDVIDIFNTGNARTNDKYLLVSFDFAQRLYDMDGAERLVVLLDDIRQTETTRARLTDKLRKTGFDVEIKTWKELSSFYTQVKNMFDMIFLFIFSIVFIVVVMSIVNTMGMAVMERTREIGTLRALGMKRWGIQRLFSTEGMILAVLGCVAGALITVLVRLAVNKAHITYVPPNFSDAVPLLVDLDIGTAVTTFLFITILATAAAFAPAVGASRKAIVDALGHV
jgi:putative ABC transport system permease protein